MTDHGRRASDGTLLSLIQGWPWRVQVVVIVLGWFGPMAVITVFFMAVWAGWIKSPVTDNTTHLLDIKATLNGAIVRMHERVVESRDKDDQTIRLLLATCRNVARDAEGRRDCESYWLPMRGK